MKLIHGKKTKKKKKKKGKKNRKDRKEIVEVESRESQGIRIPIAYFYDISKWKGEAVIAR